MSYTRRPQWAQVSLRLPRLRRTCRVRSWRASSHWEPYTRYPGHPSNWVQSVCISIPVKGVCHAAAGKGACGHPLRESAKPGQKSPAAGEKAWPATAILSGVSSRAVELTGTAPARVRHGERALAVAPFPFSKWVVQNGPERSRGRRCWARRSEPLTARTVLEDEVEGKGGGVAGVSPAGFGAAPQCYARERIRSPQNPEKPTFIADSCAQPNFGISSYELKQWLATGFVQDSIHLRGDLTLDFGLRYDRQTLSDATKNFAPRLGFGWHPWGNSRLSIRGGLGMYYAQIRSNAVASYLVNGFDGLTTYTASPGQLGFPTCLTGSCLPLSFDPKTLPASQLPARDITIRAGQRAFYESQFARYGLNFDLLPNYPDELVNPRSHVATIGAETEVIRGLFVGADYVHQHLTGIDRTVDLNAPSPFDRTAPGQVRCLDGHPTC